MKWMHHEVACVSNVDNLGSFSWFACARLVSQERDGLWTYGWDFWPRAKSLISLKMWLQPGVSLNDKNNMESPTNSNYPFCLEKKFPTPVRVENRNIPHTYFSRNSFLVCIVAFSNCNKLSRRSNGINCSITTRLIAWPPSIARTL